MSIAAALRSMQRALFVSALIHAAAASAAGASLEVQLLGSAAGQAGQETVVYAASVSARAAGGPAKAVVIDQVNKEFAPRVSVMQAGAAVSFPNKDNIRHHVYSFSPAKTFELKLYSGVPTSPVIFDKAGMIVLGCNIHDKMVAYALVVDTPYFTKTDDKGRARLAGLAPGEYDVHAWQPRPDGSVMTAVQRVRVGGDAAAPALIQLELQHAGPIGK